MRQIGGMLAWLLLGAAVAQAQTISPVIVEFREKARGSFQVLNDSFVPLNAVVETRSFSVDGDGKPTFRPLDPEIEIKLSTMSFRLGPQQAYTVFYEASAVRAPAWFCIYVVITGRTTANGIQLVVELPHTVYLVTRKPAGRESLSLLRAESLRTGSTHEIEAELENRSQAFIRVQEVEVVSASGKKTYAGFPFFPGQRRKLRLDWNQPGDPQMLVLKFPHFKLEQPIRISVASP